MATGPPRKMLPVKYKYVGILDPVENDVCGVGVNYLVVMLAANTADLHENKSFNFLMIVEIKINI